jgi:hypothetical protein
MTPLEQQNAFFDAIGKSVHHWTSVEHALGLVFCGCISRIDTCGDDGVPLAAFYAVENFRSKLNMVDAAVKARLDKHDLLKTWALGRKGLFEKTRRASKWRNKFVHYTVASPVNYKPGAIVLVPNVYNPYSHTRLGKNVEQHTYRDISRVSATWETLANCLHTFGSDIRRLRAQYEAQP